MPKKHNYYYIATSNDEYELTYFSGGTYDELLSWVSAMGDCVSKGTIIASPTGVAVTQKKKFKVMRVHKLTGEVLIGTLPANEPVLTNFDMIKCMDLEELAIWLRDNALGILTASGIRGLIALLKTEAD